MDVQAFSRLLEVLTRLSDDLQSADEEAVALQLQLIAECFRAQRNSCVQSTRNQSLLRYLKAQSCIIEMVEKNNTLSG